MKYGIYIYEGNMDSPEFRERLILDAACAYCMSHEIDCSGMELVRTEKGKPYIYGTGRDVYCNVSHSENMWICIVGEAESRTVSMSRSAGVTLRRMSRIISANTEFPDFSDFG